MSQSEWNKLPRCKDGRCRGFEENDKQCKYCGVDIVKTAILALDLGTKTGWGIYDRTITSGVEDFKPKRFEGGGMRFLRFKRWLDELNANNMIKIIYFEEVRRHAGVDAAHSYGGFMAHFTAWCEDLQIPYQGVSVGTIKRHATGKGNAKKFEMIEAMKELGYTPRDDNEADALALLLWGMENERIPR